MSDINQIRLPNGTTYDLYDKRIPGIDAAPTPESTNVVTSGGIYSAISNLLTRVPDNNASFTSRETGGSISLPANKGAAEFAEIKGKSIVWNQIVQKVFSSNWSDTGFTASLSEDNKFITINGQASRDIARKWLITSGCTGADMIAGHKYLFRCCANGGSSTSFGVRDYSGRANMFDYGNGAIAEATSSGIWYLGFDIKKDTVLNNVSFKPIIIDLTLMFGSGYEPTTVAEFEAMYRLPYYNYNAGEIVSNKATALETVGFNQWDEEVEDGSYDYNTGEKVNSSSAIASYYRSANAIKVFPNTTYCFTKIAGQSCRVFEYDAVGNYIEYSSPATVYAFNLFTTGSNTHAIRFYVGRQSLNICINLSDPSRNGTYEPYQERILNLDLGSIKVKSHNIWDEEWESGVINGGTGDEEANANYFHSKNYIPVLPGETYCIKRPRETGHTNGYVYCYDGNKNYLGLDTRISLGSEVNTFAIPSDVSYIKFAIAYPSYANNVCINLSSSFNGNYEPYGINGVITLNGGLKKAGTAYDRGIVENGVLTKVEKIIGEVDMGTLEWSYKSQGFFMASNALPLAKRVVNNSDIANILCSKYNTASAYSIYTGSANNAIGIENSIIPNVRVRDNNAGSDAATFKTAMSGVKLIYELATPLTYDVAEPIDISYPIDKGGMETRLPVDTSASVSAPMSADIVYYSTDMDFSSMYLDKSRLVQTTGSSKAHVMSQKAVTDAIEEAVEDISQDVSRKADKVSGATNGNFAALDSNGNLTDSEHKHGDYVTALGTSGNYVTWTKNGAATNLTVPFATTSSKVGTSTVGASNKPIYLNAGTPTAVGSVGEGFLSWGGQSVSGSVTPIGMSVSLEHSANRVAFINGDLVAIEYSSDGGTTWTDYGYSKGVKSALFTTSASIPIGRPDASTEVVAAQSKSRITLTAQNGNNPTGRVYTNPKKLLVNVSSATALSLLIERRTGANYNTNGSWETVGTYTVSGWSGWSDIPLILGTLGGSSTQTTNNWQLRLTFTVVTVHTSYPKTASVLGIRIFGDAAWTTPSNMAATNHLYSFDTDQNATFPGHIYPKTSGSNLGSSIYRWYVNGTTGDFSSNITANKFIKSSGTSSQFLKADGSVDSTSYETKSNKTTSLSSSSTDTQYPSAKVVYDNLLQKADKVSGATSGNFAGLDANGNIYDSGKKSSEFVSTGDLNTALATKQNILTFDNEPTTNSNNPVKSGGIKSAIDAVAITAATVTVDNNTGTPSATATVSNGTISLAFTNLKGATGATGPQGPQGPQGLQGNTGSSVNYPYELVNNLTTNDATKGLSAAQGKVLNERIAQLTDRIYGGTAFSERGYINASTGALVSSDSWWSTDYIPAAPGDSVEVLNVGTGSVTAAFYDKNKVFISSIAGGEADTRVVTTPERTCYLRSSNYKVAPADSHVKVLAIVYEQVVKAINKELSIADDQVKANNIDPLYPLAPEAATITTALTGKYYSQANGGTTISEITYEGLGSMVIENIVVGKKYFLKIAQAPEASTYRNYFIFAKSTTEAVINSSQIPNYVELIDNTEHIYLITIPAECTRVYTAGFVNTFNTFWVKDFGKKALRWLDISMDNVPQELLDKINKTENKLFDSIKKPIVFSGKNLVAFGDSITVGVCSPNLGMAGNDKYISLFCTHVGATLTNKAKSGACIVPGQNETESIYTTLTSFSGTADIIWIAGGVNDWQTQSPIGVLGDNSNTTLYGCLNLMCSFLKTNYSTATVIFVTPLPTTSTTTFGQQHPDNLNSYRRAIQEVAALNGFNVVNGDGLGLPDTMSDYGNAMFAPSDCVHPTLAGHALYFRSLCGKLL